MSAVLAVELLTKQLADRLVAMGFDDDPYCAVEVEVSRPRYGNAYETEVSIYISDDKRPAGETGWFIGQSFEEAWDKFIKTQQLDSGPGCIGVGV